MIAAHKSESPAATGLHATNTKNHTESIPQTQALINALALAGHRTIVRSHGRFSVTKYGLWRHCSDLAELQLFAKSLGVDHGL